MFLDPEIVPRSVHWRDAKGRRLDGWADVIESLEIADDEKAQACRALRAFGDVVGNLEGIGMDCGVDRVVLEQCKASIERQVESLARLPVLFQ